MPRTLPPAVRQRCIEWREGEDGSSGGNAAWVLGEDRLPPGIDRAVPKRRHEFVMGRVCVREALRALGLEPRGFLPRHTDGSPMWPHGVVGSITHAPGFAAAAVADAARFSGIGIDTEPVMNQERAQNVGTVVSWPAEVAAAKSAGLTRLEALTLVFSAKEAIFKCLYPIVHVFFDFHDACVTAVDGGARTFAARLVRPLSPSFAGGHVFEGRFDVDARGIHTGIVLASQATD